MTTKTLTAPDTFYGRIRGKAVVYSIAKDGSEYGVYCGRCGGSGYVEFSHVDNGVCFQCDGIKGELNTITVEKANQLFTNQDRAAARKEAKRLAICAERDARVARLAAAEPEVAAVLKEAYDSYQTGARVNSFYVSLSEQIHNAEGKDLTENQMAAVKRGLAKKAEEDAAKSPVVEGRGEITGVIASIKSVEGDYGVAIKVVVADDRGFRVYGSLAKSLVDTFYDAWYARVTEENGGEYPYSTYGPDHWFGEAKGARISFTATVEASKDDKAFGFFSRPTKAVAL